MKAAKPAKVAKAAAPAPAAAAPAPGGASWATDAVGLARVRAGFGVTPTDDLLFALGYPHIVVPTDGPEPKGARDVAKLWKVFPKSGATHVPRALAPYVYAYHRSRGKVDLDGPPPALDAAREMSAVFGDGPRLMFFLEAVLGAEAVARAAVDYLCKLPLGAWRSDTLDRSGWNGIRELGFVLLRVSPATHAALRARLEALFAKVSASQKEWWRPVEALDVMLHGRRGVERSGGGDWSDLAHAHDDAAWVATRAMAELAQLKPADRARFDGQIAFLGGPRIVAKLRDLRPFFREYHADAKAQLARMA